jgi:hypothetical protein
VGTADGLGARAKTTGRPAGGALGFVGARVPEAPVAERIPFAHTGDNQVYTLTPPSGGPWYVWTRDGDGDSREPRFVHVGVGGRENLDEIGTFLRDTLDRNRPALDYALRSVFGKTNPPVTVKMVVFGESALSNDWPAVVVASPRWEETYTGTDRLKLVTARFEVTACILHVDRQSQMLPAVIALGRAVQNVLNLSAYERIRLPSGLIFANCQAPSMSFQEEQIGDIGWGAEATVQWSGETTLLGDWPGMPAYPAGAPPVPGGPEA